MKKILITILAIFATSCNSMVKNGYIKPKKQESQTMIVSSNGFKYDYRDNRKVDIKYYMTIKFKNIHQAIGNYIIIEFQDPEKLDRFYSKTLPITKDDMVMYIESQKLYGFKNMRSYLTKVRLVNNNNGDKTLDSFEQYNRIEYIPYGYKNEM